MKNTLKFCAIGVALIATTQQSLAQSPSNNFSPPPVTNQFLPSSVSDLWSNATVRLGVTGGTLGFGPELGARWDNWGIRVNGTFLGFGYNTTRDSVHYQANAHLSTGGITGDWYPWAGGFRLSGGLILGDHSVDFRATPGVATTLKFNGNSYSTQDIASVSGTARYNSVMPYVGLGYDWNVWSNATISLDAGVLYQGRASLNLQANGPLAGNAVLAQDLSRESSRLRSALNQVEFYPIIQLGAGWRF